MGKIFFMVETTPEPPGPEWVSVFDDTRWERQTNVNWNGTRWNATGPGPVLKTKIGSTWFQNFRPTSMRVTGAISFAGNVTLYDGLSGNVIGTKQNNSDAVVTIALDWQYGIDMLRLDLYSYANITNIEFLGGTLG